MIILTNMFRNIFCLVAIGLSVITIIECDDAPTIGILTEELSMHNKQFFPSYSSYIAASYVKAVQGSGGRVVPILIGKNKEYYKKMLSVLNGVIFPGGASDFDVPDGYAEAGGYIYEIASEMNENGNHFPILGVCLGFELLVYLSNNKHEVRVSCNSENIGLPLRFVRGYKKSSLYGDADSYIIKILSSLPVTSNHHRKCVAPKTITKTDLRKKWNLLSVNEDDGGQMFVSSVESTTYPFAGVQFHPEKNMYEWQYSQHNPHSREAILSARHFYDWVIIEAKKNKQKYRSQAEKNEALIENFPMFFSGKNGMYYEEMYLFGENN